MILLALLGWLLVARGSASSVLFGFKTKDAAYLSANSQFENGGGVVVQNSVEWITPLGKSMIVGIVGDSSDVNFLRRELESADVEHKLNFQGESLRCEAMANYCRGIITKYLRTQTPLNVECIIAGCGGADGEPMLFWLDSIGSVQKVEYGAFGKDSAMVLSTLDRCNKECTFAEMTGYADLPSESRMVIDSLLGPSQDGNRYSDKEEYSSYPHKVIKACWSAIRARSNTLAPPGTCQVKAVSAKKGVHSFDRV